MNRRIETLRVLRAQSGDRDALNELFKDVQAPLFRCIRGIVGQVQLSEDILQEVFVILQRNLIWLREPGFFRAWAYRIASREALRHLRRERSFAVVEAEDPLSNVADPTAPDPLGAVSAERIAGVLGQLPPASRVVLVLHYLEELSLPEVAGVLGIPLGTVKSRLGYGLGLLRRQLGSEP